MQLLPSDASAEDLAYGNSFTITLKTCADPHTAHKAIPVCPGWSSTFTITATAAEGWEVVSPSGGSKDVTKTFALSDLGKEIAIGSVEFKRKDGKEDNVKADVKTSPGKRIENDPGRTDISFAKNVTATALKGLYSDVIGEGVNENIDDITAKILQAIDGKKAELVAAGNAQYGGFTMDNLVQKLKETVTAGGKTVWNQMLDDCKAAIASSSQQIKAGIDQAVEGVCADAAKCAQAVAPTGRVTGEYKHICAYRSPGDPGWEKTIAVRVIGLSEIKGGGSRGIDIPAKLEPLGVGIEIPLKLEVKASLAGKFVANNAVGTDLTVPTTPVSFFPGVQCTASIAVAGSAGLTWGGETAGTINVDFAEVSGTLTAAPCGVCGN